MRAREADHRGERQTDRPQARAEGRESVSERQSEHRVNTEREHTEQRDRPPGVHSGERREQDTGPR